MVFDLLTISRCRYGDDDDDVVPDEKQTHLNFTKGYQQRYRYFSQNDITHVEDF
jgi:hypothetical protein